MITVTLTIDDLAYLRAAVERDMEDARDIIAFGEDEYAEAAYASAVEVLKRLPAEEQAIPF
jgi:hypothetical protein